MNKRIYIALTLLFALPYIAHSQIAVQADTIHTMAGDALIHGVVLIKDGKIEQVGESIRIPNHYTVYKSKVVTPGLIDVRGTVGLSGAFNKDFDQNQLEESSPIQPELRAIDAYNPDDMLVSFLKENGITTVHTGHGWGALMSGQTMVVKTKTGTIDDVVIQPEAMVAMGLTNRVNRNFDSPSNNSKSMAMLRSALLKAQSALMNKEDDEITDLTQQMFQKLLNRELPALIHVQTAQQILNAIRLAEEFNLDLVLEGGAEAYRVIDQIKASGAKLIVHPTMMRGWGETINMTMENAAILQNAGFPVMIESGYEDYVPKTRVVLFEAAAAIRFGLSRQDALLAITKRPAELLGLDHRIGSIEKGKDADLVLFSGDPFEYTTKACVVIIDGVVEVDHCD